MSRPRVPLLDVQAQFETIREPLLRAVESALAGGRWILGPQVADLETRLGAYLHVPHAVGVASGTDALLVALRALDCGPGDEVILPSYTFFATGGAVSNIGARPVFADIEEESFNLDIDSLEAAITPRTKAIIVVHLFGQTARMDRVLEIAERRGIPVIEDAAQAIGATWGETPLGALGDLGCFSFYPSKNLGGAGDGGLITSRRDDLGDLVRMLRVHGSRVKYRHERVGFNSRLDSLQAAVLLVKLDHLDAWSQARGRNAGRYTEAFRGVDGIVSPPDLGWGRHVWNQFCIRVRRGSRDALRDHLGAQGIGTEVYYPIPLHLQPCFSDLGYKEGDLPRSERAALETLALPIYPEMTPDQQGWVIEAVTGWARSQ